MILRRTYQYRFPNFEQLCELFFLRNLTNNSEYDAPETSARRRLSKLIDYRYLRQKNIGQQRIFTLGERGKNYIKQYLKVVKLKYETELPKTLDHLVQLNWFRTKLTMACETHPAVRLLQFVPEYWSKQYITDTAGGLRHTPDALVTLKNGDKRLFFIEADSGSEDISIDGQFMMMIKYYLHYLSEGTFRERYQKLSEGNTGSGRFNVFRVLILTNGKNGTRIKNIRNKVADRIEQDYFWLSLPFESIQMKELPKRQLLRFLWVANLNDLNYKNMLGKVWKSLDGEDEREYALLGN
jgi:hypothetical protein